MLTKLKRLSLDGTQITDASCAALAAALDSGALPVLKQLSLRGMKGNTSWAARVAIHDVIQVKKLATLLDILS